MSDEAPQPLTQAHMPPQQPPRCPNTGNACGDDGDGNLHRDEVVRISLPPKPAGTVAVVIHQKN